MSIGAIDRNITGRDTLGWSGQYIGLLTNESAFIDGAMKGEKHIAPPHAALGTAGLFEHFSSLPIGVGFDANAGDETHNPMAGHANGNDIHPHNISLLPLISF